MRKNAIGAFVLGGWLLALCASALGAEGLDDYPSRALRLLCPWPAGGVADLRSRQIAERLARSLGQPVVVENRPGASGTVGITSAIQAKPDGYTFTMGSVNDLGIAPALDPKAHGKLVTGLQPITLAARGPMVLVASPALGVNTVAELIALARSKPGQLGYATSGPNTTHHFAGEMLKRAAGVDLIHVPYKGAAAMMPDLIAGNVAIGFDFAATSEALIKAGKLRALAVLGPRRVSLLPDVPTSREAGIPGVEVMSWSAFLVPVGTPASIVSRLNAELVKILRGREMTDAYTSAGYEVIASSPEDFSSFLRDEQARWVRLAKELGMVP